MKVLIVGAGIAGLTLAAFLKRKGIGCEIIEKAKKFDSVGFTFGIWYNGRRILEKLGVEKEFDKKGYSVPDYYISRGNGKLIRLCHFDEFVKKYKPLKTQIVREDLHKILLKASEGIDIKMGTTLKSVKELENSVEVHFSNGSQRSYDLVVGADGINSSVREKVFGNGFLHHNGWRGWFFWSDKNNSFPEGVFEMWEPNQFFGVFPHGGKKVCTYLARPFDRHKKDYSKNRLKMFKNHFVDLTWQVPKMVENIKNPEDMIITDLAHVNMKKWFKGRVILIGDAAHAMEPFAGMGCSMALEDAFVLSEELSSNESVNQSFKRYEKRRVPRVRFAKNKTRQIWKWTNVGSPIICSIRNLLAKYMPIRHFTEGYEILFSKVP